MLKKIVEFLVPHLKKLKKLIPIPHSSEAVSVFRKFYDWFAERDPDVDRVLDVIASFFFFLTSLGLLVFIVILCLIIGG